MGMFDKAKDLASQNPDAVEGGLGKAQQFASDKTGGQYDEQLNQAHDAARGQMGMGAREQQQGQQDEFGQQGQAEQFGQQNDEFGEQGQNEQY